MGIHYGKADFITYGKPSLLLDFAREKSLVDRITKNNLITFERASIGTYVGVDGLIKYAAADEPRFDHDPVTGESLGLLIEESRTNILGNSTNLTDNNGNDWDNVNGTIAVNQTTAPDGTNTAASFTTSAGNAEHSVVWAELVPTGNVTASVWIKPNTYSIVSFVLYGEPNSTVSYNLNTKTVYNQLSNVSRATITDYPNGWYRISATMNCTGANSRVFRLFASTGNFDASGTESFYYWGPQVESGSFETSYIPTYASNTSVTRQADTTTLSNSAFGNITQGTFVFKDFNLRGRNADSTTDPDEIGVFATFSGTNGENRILTDNNYYVSNSSSDTQTITSGQADRSVITNTPTFTSGVNRIFVSHNVTSSIGSQIRWNFTDANGLPTEVGTVLFLEIYSTRYNNGPSGSRGHYSAIMFNGSIILNSGYQAVVAGGTYERAVRKIVILTESGWEEYQNSPSITTGETASYAYSFEYDGTNTITSSAKGGVLSGSASSSGSKLPSDPSLNLNFNPSSRTYKEIILYPTRLTNDQLQNLTR